MDNGRCKIVCNLRVERLAIYRILKDEICLWVSGKSLITEKPKSSVSPTSINDIQWRKENDGYMCEGITNAELDS